MDSNTKIAPDKLETVAFILKTIGHPTRIAIIELLNNNDEMSVNDICAHLNTDQSLTSHHLSNMKLKGILKSRSEGRNKYYSLRLREVIKVINCIQNCEINL
jgi:ArsR family transcriptional regulator